MSNVADSNNNTIRKITPAGEVTTFAGTAGLSGSTDATGAAARFNSPRGVATDSAGNVYVATPSATPSARSRREAKSPRSPHRGCFRRDRCDRRRGEVQLSNRRRHRQRGQCLRGRHGQPHYPQDHACGARSPRSPAPRVLPAGPTQPGPRRASQPRCALPRRRGQCLCGRLARPRPSARSRPRAWSRLSRARRALSAAPTGPGPRRGFSARRTSPSTARAMSTSPIGATTPFAGSRRRSGEHARGGAGQQQSSDLRTGAVAGHAVRPRGDSPQRYVALHRMQRGRGGAAKPAVERKRRQGAGRPPCGRGVSLSSSTELAAVRLVLRDRFLQVAVFRARERARLVERGEALLGLREVARLQVELARVLERAAVLGVDAAALRC